jgi:transglutaminase-like putative cysteine protease
MIWLDERLRGIPARAVSIHCAPGDPEQPGRYVVHLSIRSVRVRHASARRSSR